MKTTTETEPRTEGWQGEKRYDQRKYHYIRDTESLCRALAFYRGELVAGGLTSSTSKEDCAQCKRLVDKELAKAEAAR
ncbi:MAG: hypothetical protein K0S37_778 [Microbacterium sp.]|jgi:hypothetical protein|nr:hypothetical protein [Microbacterium sp.]